MKKLIVSIALIVATAVSLPQSAKATAGGAVPPPFNPTNMFSQVVSMLVTQGMTAAAATNQANFLQAQGSPVFAQAYATLRDYFLSAYSYSLITNIPIAVSGIVWPPGSANGQVYGITNGGTCSSCWNIGNYVGNGLWQFSPTNNTLIITSRLDNVQSLLP
jgi:hypothetical protein